ncbi:RNA-binding protein [Halobacteriales archaeon QH_6_68_27]|nr:MAG: RNA-binding protein [Halobacteriales archaeon QH_6_68_27]
MRARAVGGTGVSSQVDAKSEIDAVTGLVGDDPVLAGLLVLVVALGAVLLWWVVRLRRTAGEEFASVLAGADNVSVLMHPNPDPDAMASALGVAQLAEAQGMDPEDDIYLQYAGQIRHQENRAFETVLNLDFDRVKNASDVASETVVLVDHNEPRGFGGAGTVRPAAVVDHHPGEGTGTEFTDVRPEYGSCAAILAEYFEEMGWEPLAPEAGATPGEDELPSTVATGLVYGIHSDTKNLTKGCSPAEFAASAYLYDGVDEGRLERIANPEVDAEVLDADAIPQAADELLRLEGVTAVVVVGCKRDTLHLSGRSRDDRVHMGKALEAVVNDVPMASAGGHARMGGGQLSVEHMAGLGPGEGVDRTDLRDRIFDAMAGDV